MRRYPAEFLGTFAMVFAGPACGASMNPARTLGPGLVSGQMEGLWLYPIAPLIGAALSIGAFRLIMESKQEAQEK